MTVNQALRKLNSSLKSPYPALNSQPLKLAGAITRMPSATDGRKLGVGKHPAVMDGRHRPVALGQLDQPRQGSHLGSPNLQRLGRIRRGHAPPAEETPDQTHVGIVVAAPKFILTSTFWRENRVRLATNQVPIHRECQRAFPQRVAVIARPARRTGRTEGVADRAFDGVLHRALLLLRVEKSALFVRGRILLQGVGLVVLILFHAAAAKPGRQAPSAADGESRHCSNAKFPIDVGKFSRSLPCMNQGAA